MERFYMFNNINTWYDWGLILTEKKITPPEPKTNYVKIEGMSGHLDLSEALTGEIAYDDCMIEAKFWTDKGKRIDRKRLLEKIVNTLHGKRMNIKDPDYPDSYFYGRIVVKDVVNNLAYAEFKVEATCDPWVYSNTDTVRVIDLTDAVKNVVIMNYGVKTLTPTITVSDSLTIKYGDHEKTLSAGAYKISDLLLRQGANVIGVSGTGSVTFTYKEASIPCI